MGRLCLFVFSRACICTIKLSFLPRFITNDLTFDDVRSNRAARSVLGRCDSRGDGLPWAGVPWMLDAGLEDAAEQALPPALNDRRVADLGGLTERCVLTQAGALPLRVDLCAGWWWTSPELKPVG